MPEKKNGKNTPRRAMEVRFPRLAGRRADCVLAQLKVFGTRLRPHGTLMQAETRPMTAAEMRAVAAYVQSL